MVKVCARGAQSDRCSIRRLCGGQPAGEPRAVKTPGGPCLLDRCCLWCGETQEEKLQYFILRRSDVDDHGASCDSIQQELFTLRAQVAAESGLADAVRAINNLETAQVRKDTPSLIDVKGLGCPKDFTGREEDFQQWSKKTEAFFAVIKESEMMLEWSAEHVTEITTTAIDLEFLPTDTNEDRGVQNLEFVLQQMHTALMALTSYEANDIVANSRKNALEAWRRLQKRYDATTGGRKRNVLRTIISPGQCSLLELQAGIERWESYVSRYEKKMKDKIDDEIKLAGVGSLVPEELEKHVILDSNRLRTFEDARLEVVTYVEAKFCLRSGDPKPSDTGARGHSDPKDVDAINSLFCQRKRIIESAGWVFLSAVEHIQRDCTTRKSTGNQSYGKGKQSKSWSKSEPWEIRRKIQRNQKCEPRCQRLTQGQNIESWSLRS